MSGYGQSLVELVGQFMPMVVGPFAFVEGSVAATTDVPLAGPVGGEPKGIYAPWPGRIVALSVGGEASANFTVKATIGGVVKGDAVTVDGAANNLKLPYTSDLEFAAGDLLGIQVVADTTSKDMNGFLFVIFDLLG